MRRVKRIRKVKKTLRTKYNLPHNIEHFAWFPNRKGKRYGDFIIFPTPSCNKEEVKEVISIISSFTPKHLPSQDAVKNLFQSGWKIDYMFFPEEGLWSFDAYKNGVAVEVLGKHIDEVYKDCFKFLLAYRAKKTKIGVIVVPHQTQQSEHPDAISVDTILHRFSPVLKDYGLWIFRASYSMGS